MSCWPNSALPGPSSTHLRTLHPDVAGEAHFPGHFWSPVDACVDVFPLQLPDTISSRFPESFSGQLVSIVPLFFPLFVGKVNSLIASPAGCWRALPGRAEGSDLQPPCLPHLAPWPSGARRPVSVGPGTDCPCPGARTRTQASPSRQVQSPIASGFQSTPGVPICSFPSFGHDLHHPKLVVEELRKTCSWCGEQCLWPFCIAHNRWSSFIGAKIGAHGKIDCFGTDAD